MTVTIKDLARRVGKSVTTVSRALHDYDDVSQETKALVRKTAHEMGYSPNTNAQRLQKQRSESIGFLIPAEGPNFSDPFFGDMLSGIAEESARKDFDLLVTTLASAENETDRYLHYIRSRRVDGFIIVRTVRDDMRIDLLKAHPLPFVAFGRVEGKLDFPFVDDDGELGIRQMVQHLINLGHTKFACIGEPEHLTKAYHRVQGFRNALQEHGMPVDENRIIINGFRQASGEQAGHHLFDLPDPPTAIVAINDLLALGAIRAAQQRGLEVGADISISGFDDILLAEFIHPGLTTLRLPAREIGRMLCQMLIGLIQNGSLPNPDKQILIQPELIVRESTGPPRR